jgi:transcription-repair coupling factor (superfamily II helicase)
MALREDLNALVGECVAWLAPWDVPKGSDREPSTSVVEQRMLALESLLKDPSSVVVACPESLLQPVQLPETLEASIVQLSVGSFCEMEDLIQRLVELGYERMGMVEDIGEIAVRGGIVDIYPFGYEDPLRIEFDGDMIASLRRFDPLTQRSVDQLQGIRVLPFREEVWFDEVNPPAQKQPMGIWYYLSPNTLVVLEEPYEILRSAAALEGIESQEVAALSRTFGGLLQRTIVLSTHGEVQVTIKPHAPYMGHLDMLRNDVSYYLGENYHCFLLCSSEGQRERLYEIVGEEFTDLELMVGSLTNGFALPEARLAVFTDTQTFGLRRPRRRLRRIKVGIPIDDLLSLRRGDYVVHVDYGIGRFENISRINVHGREAEFLTLRYAGGDKLHVPIDRMDAVQRYVGTSEKPPTLSRLGTRAWENRKRRARKVICDMTGELLDLYAARRALTGTSFSADGPLQKELEASFPYQETDDQLHTMEEIKGDMETRMPMDRLVCGEVGYGKTEIALRAAFKCAAEGMQTALLVPTTVLAEQHYRTFTERLEPFPVIVKLLSRFQTPREQKGVVHGLVNGTVDIVIGTHRLLSRDISFRNLGLIIIDEEHRFGVAHKEKLKKLRNLVDVLSMSATPIPRTLQMSLLRVRDLSTIDTPPRGRMPVITEVCTWDEELIVDAILREMERSGQVYFVHNRVDTIESIAELLRRLLPHLTFGVAHGQLRERELESTMLHFLHRKYDVLVTTAIIESGLDIPNVNTILVNRADHFGLAQLHQLRGRVGRSDRKAYAYFLVPKDGKITEDARKRLAAIRSYAELGSGMKLALRDLEIRGAGNLLGPEQHGHIAAIGFDLYCRMLDEAVRRLKGEEVPVEWEPKLDLDVEAYLPDEYIEDPEHKIAIYKRLASMRRGEDRQDLEQELLDRFGPLPPQAEALLDVIDTKIKAREAGAEKLWLRQPHFRIHLRPERQLTRQDIERIVRHTRLGLEFEVGPPFILRGHLERHHPPLAQMKKLLKNMS